MNRFCTLAYLTLARIAFLSVDEQNTNTHNFQEHSCTHCIVPLSGSNHINCDVKTSMALSSGSFVTLLKLLRRKCLLLLTLQQT